MISGYVINDGVSEIKKLHHTPLTLKAKIFQLFSFCKSSLANDEIKQKDIFTVALYGQPIYKHKRPFSRHQQSSLLTERESLSFTAISANIMRIFLARN